ncbi:response regulator [Corynebacterium epidermidicanis]|uniref:Two component transcriptional regulator, LuxR family n=1 Tax=Corynebacterium epidermidicanis TaxID=1050174 RepID=A0A0G3GLG3_9CORY|nr:response regulator transcription factor [Corynebacterium epidermidicanis]AKK02004.1 two component transcriptional regulator, LuxR family [Corynebacterium epidermidicanis]
MDTTEQIWVLLVDDDPLVMSSLKAYFASTPDIRVAAEARNGVEALEILDRVSVDIILTDIHMPEMDGVTLLREVKKRPNPPVFVAITALDTDATMIDILTGGGAGYIVKSSRPQTIIAAVRDALQGGTTVSPQAMTRLVDRLSAPEPADQPDKGKFDEVFATLNSNEKQILALICEGKSNEEIAGVTHYAESTVKKQVSHLISLFGVTSRLSLAVTALRSRSMQRFLR